MDLRLYRIVDKCYGYETLFTPNIPQNIMDKENTTIKRICTAPTIPGCIESIQPLCNDAYKERLLNGEEITLYLYYTKVNKFENLYFPDTEDVPDAYKTGEVWVIKPYRFRFVSELKIRYHMDIPHSVYSRILCRYSGEKEILDFRTGDPIYGDKRSFSMIVTNPNRYDSALDYAVSNEILFYPNSEAKVIARNKSLVTAEEIRGKTVYKHKRRKR